MRRALPAVRQPRVQRVTDREGPRTQIDLAPAESQGLAEGLIDSNRGLTKADVGQ